MRLIRTVGEACNRYNILKNYATSRTEFWISVSNGKRVKRDRYVIFESSTSYGYRLSAAVLTK